MTTQNIPQNMKAKVVDLTPELAEKLLGKNTHNRTARTRHVKKLAGAIQRGEWTFNGEAIKIDKNGVILDGQHRILAVIEADTSITVLIIEGLDPDTQDTMDSGIARTLGDALKLRGEHNWSVLAASLRSLYAFEKTGLPSVVGGASAPTTRECLEVLDRHPGLRESVNYAKQRSNTSPSKLLVASAVAVLHYIFSVAQSGDEAETFFDKLGSGEDLKIGDPIMTLRIRLVDDIGATSKLNVKQKLAFTIRAFNGWLDGERLMRLLWKAGGSNPDAFPRVKGWEILSPETTKGEV